MKGDGISSCFTARPIGKAAPKSRRSAIAQLPTREGEIGGSESSHSFMPIFPVSPSPEGNFGQEQSGTDFGGDVLNRYQRAHRGNDPRTVRLRENSIRRFYPAAILVPTTRADVLTRGL
jgi:hypothetical protein